MALRLYAIWATNRLVLTGILGLGLVEPICNIVRTDFCIGDPGGGEFLTFAPFQINYSTIKVVSVPSIVGCGQHSLHSVQRGLL